MRTFLFVLLSLLSLNSIAQHTTPGATRAKFEANLDSLQALSYQVINNPNEPERYNANYTMVKTLINTLKLPNSFNFSFDSLKTISTLTSPDKRFKIFTWHVMNQDGSYRYYGTIQMNNPSGKLQMFPLVDYTHSFKNPQDSVTSNSNWYGSQYYKIIPVLYNVPRPYYILLGWKGNNVKSTKKVIEVLSFENGKAVFGKPVFEGDKERPGKKRIVFEYSRQVSFMLNYLQREGTIVFDHLAPPDPNLKDRPEMYGPDMSYDGFKLLNGKWKYVADIPLKNPPSALDGLFNDPKKPVKNASDKLR